MVNHLDEVSQGRIVSFLFGESQGTALLEGGNLLFHRREAKQRDTDIDPRRKREQSRAELDVESIRGIMHHDGEAIFDGRIFFDPFSHLRKKVAELIKLIRKIKNLRSFVLGDSKIGER